MGMLTPVRYALQLLQNRSGQSLVATVRLPVSACESAKARGNEADQPRNLVQSVPAE